MHACMLMHAQALRAWVHACMVHACMRACALACMHAQTLCARTHAKTLNERTAEPGRSALNPLHAPADTFSFGVTMWEAFMGLQPFYKLPGGGFQVSRLGGSG